MVADWGGMGNRVEKPQAADVIGIDKIIKK
jgi:hypothetical protein